MSDNIHELEKLLEAEREACSRSRRLDAAHSTMLDEGMRRAAGRICDEAKADIVSFTKIHKGDDWLGIVSTLVPLS
jgi:hypothetical protein